MEEWTILIVDEGTAVWEALAGCLLMDYRGLQVGSVREALHILEKQGVDVIISNLSITDPTGLDLFMRARVTLPKAVRIGSRMTPTSGTWSTSSTRPRSISSFRSRGIRISCGC